MTSLPDLEINRDYPVAIEKRVQKGIAVRQAAFPGDENAFYIVDMEPVVSRFMAWKNAFPNIVPYYAVKCNSNPVLLKTLRALGSGFDCASQDELDRIVALGVPPSDIIFANPCKMATQIAHARRLGVTHMTFDNDDELVKVAHIFPEAELVIRIATDDSHSEWRFSGKFGAPMKDVPHLLETAAKLGLKVVGVSYHVGSSCSDPNSHAAAATDALSVFQMGKKYGFNMTLLDIGGGFLGEDNPNPSVASIALHLEPVLAQFPAGTRFIAEPGRYFATACHTLVTNIQSRRVTRDPQGNPTHVLYYMNDGVYQAFNCIFFDHKHPLPHVLIADQLEKRAIVPSTVFGPTCDIIDCVCKDVPMPLLEIGKWLFFIDMGAYTTAACTRFNGFEGAVDYVYMYVDTVIPESALDSVESVRMTLSKFVPNAFAASPESIARSPDEMATDSPLVTME